MFNPLSTYRLQFHEDFTFNDLEQLIPYLQKLGIKTIYASPIFTAVPGSKHGYDNVDPNQINPEIGTIEQLEKLSKLLQSKGLAWLQDIVPNHMAYHQDNPWLMDVLEKGEESLYASFFDIIWNAKNPTPLMAPFLGSSLESAITQGEVKVAYQEQRYVLAYYDNYFPLKQESRTILQQLDDDLERGLEIANKDHSLLLQIATDQNYRLCYWQETDRQINYRRFFTVNSLICLNMQDEKVFEAVHKHSRSLVKKSIIQGLRLDHIDGLYDPTKYLDRLRAFMGEETYIIVEKILVPGEKLPEYWPLQGNTGYDFLGLVNNLFTNKNSESAFTEFYQQLINNTDTIQQQTYAKKRYILHQHMAGELENLYRLFINSDLVNPDELERIQPEDLKQAIAEFLIYCPVYRYYGNSFPLDTTEAGEVSNIINNIKNDLNHNLEANSPSVAVELLEQVLLQKPEQKLAQGDADYNQRLLHFYRRSMQFTGPLMAKGFEDTLMYTYDRFIGHNDVGDSPQEFGYSVPEFHQKMLERQQCWPLSLNATSTHDTKRGEDVRARLNVLTNLPEEWFQIVRQWQQLNEGLKQNGTPDANDEYFIYQTLLGAYPLPGDGEDDFLERLLNYLPKALREAKMHSTWSEPNEIYENATKEFASKLLDKQTDFWQSFVKFHQKVADYGIINSLAQVVLKYTCPGVPDTYQGTEFWDLSLVDPDNRRPVDYDLRQGYLEEWETLKENKAEFLTHLWQNRNNAGIKLFLIQTLLQIRQQQPELFGQGAYVPLQITGEYQEHVIAFARTYGHLWYVIVLPLHSAALPQDGSLDIFNWRDTSVVLPENAPADWEHLLLGIKGRSAEKLLLNDIFRIIPLAILSL